MTVISTLDRSGPAASVAGSPPLLSVVVKCHNEEGNIAACLDSVLAATAGLDVEVIVADALSADRTVEIARRYPVLIARMTDSFNTTSFLLLQIQIPLYFFPIFAPLCLQHKFLNHEPLPLHSSGGQAVATTAGNFRCTTERKPIFPCIEKRCGSSIGDSVASPIDHRTKGAGWQLRLSPCL